ncbi:hypothetical protein H6P81_006487 [Aristolochia fimbriata]|uniref:Uncharacterized protein n=1 Tax=Aristolochia fimbriata TaxID=158543 RepID=A0AAV7EXV9_ARIFI|nr:hypothetical protein H6P81_006487 [Aristolochia fimbriata]
MVRELSHGHAVVSPIVSINYATTSVASTVKKMPRIRRRTYKVHSSIKGGTTTRQISPWMTEFSLVDSRLIKECLSSEECYMKCMKNIAVPYKFICEATQEEFITDIYRGQESPKKHNAKLKKGEGRARKGEGRLRTGEKIFEKDHIPRIRGEIVGDILRGKAVKNCVVGFLNCQNVHNNALRGRLGDAPTWTGYQRGWTKSIPIRVLSRGYDPMSRMWFPSGRVEDLGGKRIFREQPVEDLVEAVTTTGNPDIKFLAALIILNLGGFYF